jgi:septal ring factor EnvC (AmiA/AmiB activator)
MSDDLLGRLGWGCNCGKCKLDLCCCATMEEAKDEIKRLRKELKSEQKQSDSVLDNYDAMERRIEAQAMEIERLRKVVDSMIESMANITALAIPTKFIIE